MADEYKGLHVRFRGEDGDLTRVLRSIGSEARTAQSRLRGVQSALKLDPKSPALLAERLKYASEAATRTRERLNALKSAQEQLAASGDTTSEVYQRLSYDIARTEAYYRRDAAALVKVTESMTALGRASTALDAYAAKAAAASASIQGLGSRLTTGVTLPIAAAGGLMVKSAVDVDTALTGVRKTVDMTEEGYRKLKDGAVELSKTQPVSASAILDIETMGGQLGWANDRLQDFAMTVSGLDIATDMDADTAATNLAQFANVTRMAQDQAQNYASAIVGLGNNMATTESKISDMALNMASAGTQAGMSQADILGVAAAVSSLGMEAQAGGSAFSKTINEIGMQVSSGGDGLEKWAQLAHMSAEEFKSAWGSDVTGTFERVVQGMSEVSANGGDLNTTLAELGITELRQSDLMRRLAGNSDLLTRAVDLSNTSWRENTALAREVGSCRARRAT
ncbi:phage tail tape measure protein [Collinsella vaginalis]|uniref:phage tail tape measure protein n=1 Tax=Collinsella vaginalis TaxID=1870987 RepID=UPI000A2728CD|nr:phage tail tape measure protein [Collinsella vaginalis]